MPTDGARKTLTRRTPFVGRQRELEEFERYLKDAESGRSALVLLAGDAGIGKTRIAQEVARRAADRGFLVLLGHCYEDEAAEPYGAFIEALRPLTRSLPEPVLRRAIGSHRVLLSHLLPDLSEADAHPNVSMTPSPERERIQLFNAVGDMLKQVSISLPIHLILEDLHWADAPTILLLRHLTQSLEGEHVVILCTYRPIEVASEGHAASMLAFLEHVHRQRLGSVMTVEAMSAPDIQIMLGGMVEEAASPSLAHAIHAQTEGNPFFAEELIRHLAEEGTLFQGDGRLVTTIRSEDVGVPEGVRVVTTRRLARLSESCRRMLTVAAVLGKRFEFDLLDAVLDTPGDAVVDDIEEASRAHLLLSEVGERHAQLAFSHELVRQTLLQRISTVRRQQLHLRIAETIERLGGRSTHQQTRELAYHYLLAGAVADKETTLDYVARAADSAIAATAYEDAVPLLKAALMLIPADDMERRCDFLLMLGDAEKRISDSDTARDAYSKAAELARSLRSPARLRRAALGFAHSWPTVGSVDEPAVRLLREALATFSPGDQSSVRAGLTARLALQLYYSGDTSEVNALSARAVELARASGDKARRASTLQSRHVFLWEPQHLNERLTIASEIIDLAAQLADDEVALWGHRPRIADYAELGAVDEVRREVATYLRLAKASRRPLYIWQALVRQAMLASYDGRFADAERFAQESLVVGRQAEGQNLMAAFGGQLLVVRWQQGRMAELESLVTSSMAQQPQATTWRAVLAFIYCETGRVAEARAAFEQLYRDGPPALAADNTRLIDLVVLALVCAQVGADRCVDSLYEGLLPYAGRNIVFAEGVVCVGSADYYLGILAATARRWDDATRHFDAALEMNERGRAPSWQALTQYDYSRLLLARRGRGDRQRARRLLDAARATAMDLGMAVLSQRIERLLATRRSLREEADGLTGREVEVLRLIAQGRSNQEISTELSLSPRTTARHISNTYGKIGARNRADATAYAIRQGLVQT